jgi:hypothetical protein
MPEAPNDEVRESSASNEERRKPHPIARAINIAVRRARDIDESDMEFVAAANEHKHTTLDEILAQLKALRDEARQANPEAPVPGNRVQRLLDLIRQSDRAATANRAATLRTSLLLGLFSAFDAFIGDLVTGLFNQKPELFNRLSGNVSMGDVLAAESIADLKAGILADEVESLRRKSYVEQFETLEKLFDITLTSFERWPSFVEVSQRRNLFAHCNGVVSEQYLAVCKKHKVAIDPKAVIGSALRLDRNYMDQACRLIAEVALKLGQTLWRKALPDELSLADTHLTRVGLEALQFEEWEWAAIIGEFALSQKKWSDDQARRIFIVNHAIALKFGGRNEAALALLSAHDWSASLPEFKLANAVLREQFDLAAEIMLRIGEAGELVEQQAYLDWPLFRDFRGTQQFAAAYEQIYREPLVVAVDSSVDAAERRAERADDSADPAA